MRSKTETTSLVGFLQEFWNTLELNSDQNVAHIPATLSSHLNIQHSLCDRRTLYMKLVGHLQRTDIKEMTFYCKHSYTIPMIPNIVRECIENHLDRSMICRTPPPVNPSVTESGLKKRWLQQVDSDMNREKDTMNNIDTSHASDTVDILDLTTHTVTTMVLDDTTGNFVTLNLTELEGFSSTQGQEASNDQCPQATSYIDIPFTSIDRPVADETYNPEEQTIPLACDKMLAEESNSLQSSYRQDTYCQNTNYYNQNTYNCQSTEASSSQNTPASSSQVTDTSSSLNAEATSSTADLYTLGTEDINRYDRTVPAPEGIYVSYNSSESESEESDADSSETKRVKLNMQVTAAAQTIRQQIAEQKARTSMLVTSEDERLLDSPPPSDTDGTLAQTTHPTLLTNLTEIPPGFLHPPTEGIDDICEGLIKDQPTIEVNNRLRIISKFPQLSLTLAKEAHNTLFRGLAKLPVPSSSYLYANRSKVLYANLKDHVTKIQDISSISWHDVSSDELEICQTSTQPEEHYSCKLYRQTPSKFSITGEQIPAHLLKHTKAVLIASSDLFTSLNHRYLSNILNMSPGYQLFYNGEENSHNTLLAYIREVQKQLGPHSMRPIVVEFFQTSYIGIEESLITPMARNFIRTLSFAQKNYGGLILGLCSPVYWDPSVNLPTYQAIKGLHLRIGESLTSFGLGYNIFVLCPSLVSPPIIGPTGRTGYLMRNSFLRTPLFAKNGKFTPELERRAMRGLREELQFVRSMGFA